MCGERKIRRAVGECSSRWCKAFRSKVRAWARASSWSSGFDSAGWVIKKLPIHKLPTNCSLYDKVVTLELLVVAEDRDSDETDDDEVSLGSRISHSRYDNEITIINQCARALRSGLTCFTFPFPSSSSDLISLWAIIERRLSPQRLRSVPIMSVSFPNL